MKLNLGRSVFAKDEYQKGGLKERTTEFAGNESNPQFKSGGEKSLSSRFDLIVEFPFTSEVKMMTTVFHDNDLDEYVGLTKGMVCKIDF